MCYLVLSDESLEKYKHPISQKQQKSKIQEYQDIQLIHNFCFQTAETRDVLTNLFSLTTASHCELKWLILIQHECYITLVPVSLFCPFSYFLHNFQLLKEVFNLLTE